MGTKAMIALMVTYFEKSLWNKNFNLKSECDKSWRQLCKYDVFKNWRTIKEVLFFQYTYLKNNEKLEEV